MSDTDLAPTALAMPSSVEPTPDLQPRPRGAEAARVSAGRSAPAWPPWVAAAVGALSLLLPLGWAGLWAPHELEVANLARRIAVFLHGADQLALAGAESHVPTLTELGKGQLPFSSIALGFQLFGLSDWAGRLPLALWGLSGLAALFILVGRLVDSRAAAYAATTLATMPLFFIQSRTMLGDGVTLAAVAASTAALSLGVFTELRRPAWLACLGAAVLGLAAGFASRGLLLGVACPLLGVGLAWASWRGTGRELARNRSALGGTALAVGAATLGVGLWAAFGASESVALELLGTTRATPTKLLTHDSLLHQLGHALFPWSAAAPALVAVALRPAPEAPPGRLALALCLGCTALSAFLVHGLGAPAVGAIPFVGSFAIAGLVGVGLRDLETRPRHTRALTLATAALMVILALDFDRQPDEALSAFAVSGADLPESFSEATHGFVKYCSLACVGVLCLVLGEFERSPRPRQSEGRALWRWFPSLEPRTGELWTNLSRAWNGLGRAARAAGLLTMLALLLAAALALVDQHLVPVGPVRRLSVLQPLLRFGFLAPPALLLLYALALGGGDLLRRVLAALPASPARIAWIALTGFGLAMSLDYYPALARHLSPRHVFEAYRARADPSEPLAVLGSAADVAPYYGASQVITPKNAKAAHEWLVAPNEGRKWLIAPTKVLAQLNSLQRSHSPQRANLPILEALSSDTSLASNLLREGEVDENPFADWIRSERPSVQHPLEVKLKQQLRCLGWSLLDQNGRPVDVAVRGRPYQFEIHWEVLAPLHKQWKTFIHIDGHGRRHNGDHETLEGKYPMRFWNVGDFMTDMHSVELAATFSAATYKVYFGLFSGNTRLQVSEGAHHDNRIEAGDLIVR